MFKRILVLLSILGIVLFPYSFHQKAEAAALTSMSDVMTRQVESANSNHTIEFTLPASDDIIEDETITLTFQAGFTMTGISCEDIDIEDDTVDEDVQEEAGSCTANATEWGVGLSGQVITLTAPSTAQTYIAASSVISIEIGTHATADDPGADQIDNPATDGSYTVAINADGDTGTLAVPIVNDDQVTVSGTVDPSITSVISSSTCTLTPDPITISNVSVCSYTNTVDTNNGTALNVSTTTTIGSPGMTFQSISSAGSATQGINLTNLTGNVSGVCPECGERI